MKALLSDAVDDWLRFRRSQDIKPTTLRGQASTLRRFLTHVGNIYTDRITDHHVTRFMEEASKTRQPQSLRNDHACLSVFFDWCRHTKRMRPEQDPMYGRRVPKVVRRERNRLHVSQFPALLSAAGERCPRDRAVIAVLLYTLLRDKEVTDLRVGDLDLDGGWLRARITKSGLEDRMPVSEELDRELRVWLTAYTAEVGHLHPNYRLIPARKITPVRKDGRRWTRADMEAVLLPDTRMGPLHKIVQPTLEAIGFPVVDSAGNKVSEGAHTIRRSGARALFDALNQAGYDFALRVIQSMLHHSSVTVTEHYLGITADRRSRDDILRGKPMYGRTADNVTFLNTADAQAR